MRQPRKDNVEERKSKSEDNGDGKLKRSPADEELWNAMKQKTPEQLKQERIGRFTKDPDTFIELSELVCAVIRNPKSQLGISVFIGNAKRSELNNGQSELNHRIELARRQMDIETEMRKEADKNLIHKPHGIFDFARKRR